MKKYLVVIVSNSYNWDDKFRQISAESPQDAFNQILEEEQWAYQFFSKLPFDQALEIINEIGNVAVYEIIGPPNTKIFENWRNLIKKNILNAKQTDQNETKLKQLEELAKELGKTIV